nr:MAG TPA: zinc ribbon domain protein [Caudoviricetes sp.]
MNNAELMKGLDMTIEGLSMIREALLEQNSVASTVAVGKSEKVEEPLEVVDTTEDLRASLQRMKYNEFKKYAASLGVKCTGSRDEILERILALKSDEQSSEDAETTEEVVEKTPDKSDSVSKVKRKTAEEVEEDSRDEFDKQAEEIAETTDVGDILEALDDVGIKATKKNYLSKLAEALREGLIEADDSDEEDSEDGVEETEEELPFEDETSSEKDADEDSDDEEVDEDSYFPQYDPEGFNDPDGSYMTDERAEKIHETVGSIISNYGDESLTSDEVEKYIEEHATQEEIDLLGEDYTEEDALKLYIELVKRTIDNDGEEHDTHDPYEIGEDNFCCGHKLKYMKKTGNYYCELCGEEYEAE